MDRRDFTLSSFFSEVYVHHRTLSVACRDNYITAIRLLEADLGGPASLSGITPELVSRWLYRLEQRGRSPHYLHSLRAAILAVWRCAWELSHEDIRLGSVRKPMIRRVSRPATANTAWTADDVTRLVKAADQLPGDFEMIRRPRSWYFSTLIRAGWYTGLRQGDLLRLRREQIGADGRWTQIQGKTGRTVQQELYRELLAEIDRYADTTGLIWPMPGSRETFRKWFNRLVRQAGLVGTCKKLRKSAGTAYELLNPGMGQVLLGNERRTFERSYLDQSRIAEAGKRPEKL